MSAPRMLVLASVAAITLIATACATNDVPTTPEAASPRAVASAPPTVEASPNVAVTPTPASSTASLSPASDMQPIAAGRHSLQVLGTGTYPSISVKVPKGWYDVGGQFVNAGPNRDGELSVWDVEQVFRHPCHWQGQAYDPGPTVPDLVKALRAQPTRHYRANDTKLAGYSGSSSSVRLRSTRNRVTSVRMGHRSSSDGRATAQAGQQPVAGQMDQAVRDRCRRPAACRRRHQVLLRFGDRATSSRGWCTRSGSRLPKGRVGARSPGACGWPARARCLRDP